jgi:hypothetical protein
MLFPQEIFDIILSYLITPVPFKVGSTYYVSYLGFVGNPNLDKIKIESIFTQDNETFVNYILTSFIFYNTNPTWSDIQLRYTNKKTLLYNTFNMFYIRVHSSITRPMPGALYSRNTTDEAKAFEILLSRLDENSEWITPIIHYCTIQNIVV